MPPPVRGVLVLGLHLAAAAPLVAQLPYGGVDRFAVLTTYFVVLGFVLPAIEGTVFTEGPGPVSGRDAVGGVALGLALGAAAAWLLPGGGDASLAETLSAWFEARGTQAWFRIAYASIAFMVAYCVIGSATWPFVRRYYEDGSLGLRLRVPSGPVVIALQLARGFVATLVVLLLLAPTANGTSPSDAARLALSLAVTTAIAPMLAMPQWPARLRVTHGIEISLFSIVQAVAWWGFLGR